MKNDFTDTAKKYILYRNKRSELRKAFGPVSEAVRAAVEESSKYFSSPYSEYIFYQFYSRWVPELGRRETWIEAIDRYMAYMKENMGDKLTAKEYTEVREAILNQDICPSMRLLWSSGKACRQFKCLGLQLLLYCSDLSARLGRNNVYFNVRSRTWFCGGMGKCSAISAN